MLARERQRKIYEMIELKGAVTTSKLMEIFDVSIETVRRDLLLMEREGKLSRVHGGAVTKGNMKGYSELWERNKEQNTQKEELSLKATEFINDGDVVSIDSGSTAIFFASAIKEKFSELTVITYSADVFEILEKCKNFKVILCGGHYIPEERAFAGDITLDALKKLHIQKAFVCPSAISLEFGIFDYQKDIILMQKQIFNSSDDIYILADSSKFEKKALLKLADMKNDFTYITDSLLSEELKKLYKENGISIF